MSRNVSDLHPVLQVKAEQLKELCKENGIAIGISECLRTVEEQNDLYAKGRTAPGSIVTNCKGTSYSSMHQWGVAFDFYLDMDVDGDGKKSDDAFNNSKKLFEKVGKLGQSIGLEWGGSWKNKDLPHFQLPDWGSTASKLKKTYGTPDKFMETWKDESKKEESAEVPKKESAPAQKKENAHKKYVAKESARVYNPKYARTYTTSANLNMRHGAGTNKQLMITLPKGTKVKNYGYYSVAYGEKWLYVVAEIKGVEYTGFCSKKYLL